MVSVARHPVTGKLIHLLAYQNHAVNLFAQGGNAMLLHFPGQNMTRENVVDTSKFPDFLEDAKRAIDPPRPRNYGSRMLFGSAQPKAFEVFDHDIYTVVLAKSAEAIPEALAEVREDRRPRINREIFDFYAEKYLRHSFALCCFNNRDRERANPLLWWYEPENSNELVMPGIDAHDGKAPDLMSEVTMDHWTIVGTRNPKNLQAWKEVNYSDALPAFAKRILPTHVTGRQFNDRGANADFFATLDPDNDTFSITRGRAA